MRAMTAIELLQKMIATESFSRNESAVAEIVQRYLEHNGVFCNRHLNNVWCVNKYYDSSKPTLLLNSHIDTVKPNRDWTRNPFEPTIENGVLYGLGSNDAGGCVVSLVQTFINFYNRTDLTFNIVLAITAEEEISGENGIVAVAPALPHFDCAIVGEPTEMQLAIAEKGLMVLRCTAQGKSGHAARNEGVNAIDIAMRDIEWFHSYKFDRTSGYLGEIKMTVTIINAGTQHNVVPDRCDFTVDVRTTDVYTNDETLAIITDNIRSNVADVSRRLQPSRIERSHPLALAATTIGMIPYGSPTLSDQALLRVPSVKIGPGSSSRSHTADEFIHVHEVEQGITRYCELLECFDSILKERNETLG
ncbi:MAG: M20 family metallo-hydrolase [Candidatus Kapabacteria bacterium]|nr:M20 family metallo-hydrolase [Candidatus Kapabacteria bacterium]